jgi:hypothetical protein
MNNDPIRIVVIDSGWVIVGRVAESKAGVSITQASVVRQWGTSKGLGQLAIDGPQKETVLDKIGVVHVNPDQIKFLVECDHEVWAKKLWPSK